MKILSILFLLFLSFSVCYADETEVNIATNRLIEEQLDGLEYVIEKQPNHPNIDRMKAIREFLRELKRKSTLEKAKWAIPKLEIEVKGIEGVFDTDPEKRTEKTIKIYRQKQKDLYIIKDWYSTNQ
jgi:hypothetical protein